MSRKHSHRVTRLQRLDPDELEDLETTKKGRFKKRNHRAANPGSRKAAEVTLPHLKFMEGPDP